MSGKGNQYGKMSGPTSKTNQCTWTTDPLPHEKPMPPPAFGWKDLPSELKDIQLPSRNGNATESIRPQDVNVNHFPVKINLPNTIYGYQLEIKRHPRAGGDNAGPPRIPKFLYRPIHLNLLKNLRAEYMENTEECIGIISDFGQALYSTKKLEDFGINLERDVEYVPKDGEDGRQETFLATITPTNEEIDTTKVETILNNTKGEAIIPELLAVERIYNILLKNLSTEKFFPVGKSQLICFHREHGTRLGEGLMSFSGYDIDFEITNGWKPLLNIMVANTATLMSGKVRDVLASLFGMKAEDCISVRGWEDKDFQKASKHLEMIKVKYSPERGKTFGGTVDRVSNKSISEESFLWNDEGNKRQVTVYDYFVEKYKGLKLRRDGLCLVVNRKNFVPAEICEVKEGQVVHRKLNSNQTNAMLKLAKKDPHVLKPEIENAIADLNLREDPILKAFGVTIENTSMLSIKARILPAPLICYGGKPPKLDQRARITPDDGVWDNWKNMSPFLESKAVGNWGILNTSGGYNVDGKSRFVEMLVTHCSKVGIKIENPKPSLIKDLSKYLQDSWKCQEGNMEALKKFFSRTKTEDCRIIFVVIPHDASFYYGHVKQAAELHSGILTQCVTLDNFLNPNPSEIKNIILKMNNKLGGVNHTVMSSRGAIPFGIFEYPVLIMGADVTHPPPHLQGDNESEALSFAALTSSIDRTGMRYMTQVKAQKKIGRKAAEVIQDFEGLVAQSLRRFHFNTKQTPKKIIYFRDGVGDGQFQELLHTEMRQMREACFSMSPTYQPKITFITVQKRHKTRFFINATDTVGKTVVRNAPAGTIVDTEIVHPTEMDSFLLSHRSLLGTSRPTRYRVLWDDSDFTQDQIQQMTYYLCHMYARCNRAVSIPAPTYYAHHAATRAKVLADGLSGSVEEINKLLQRTDIDKTNPMHFI